MVFLYLPCLVLIVNKMYAYSNMTINFTYASLTGPLGLITTYKNYL